MRIKLCTGVEKAGTAAAASFGGRRWSCEAIKLLLHPITGSDSIVREIIALLGLPKSACGEDMLAEYPFSMFAISSLVLMFYLVFF